MSGWVKIGWGTLLGLIFAVVTSGSLMKAEALEGEPKTPVVVEATEASDVPVAERASTVEETKEEKLVVNEEKAPAAEDVDSKAVSSVERGDEVASSVKKPQIFIRGFASLLTSMKHRTNVVAEGLFQCLNRRDDFYSYTEHNWFVTNFYKFLDWTYKKIWNKKLYVKKPISVLINNASVVVKSGGRILKRKSKWGHGGAWRDDEIDLLKKRIETMRPDDCEKLKKLIDVIFEEQEKLLSVIQSDGEFFRSTENKNFMLSLINKICLGEGTKTDFEKMDKICDKAIAVDLEGFTKVKNLISIYRKRNEHLDVIKNADKQICFVFSEWEKEKERLLKEVSDKNLNDVHKNLRDLAKETEMAARVIGEYEKVKEENKKKLDPGLGDKIDLGLSGL